MSNTIQIKRGPNTPTINVLSNYELGYSTTNKGLYIRDDSSIIPLNDSFVTINKLQNEWTLDETTGYYTATISASTHGLGTNVFVQSVEEIITSGNLTTYKSILYNSSITNGNITIYVQVQKDIKITLCGSYGSVINSINFSYSNTIPITGNNGDIFFHIRNISNIIAEGTVNTITTKSGISIECEWYYRQWSNNITELWMTLPHENTDGTATGLNNFWNRSNNTSITKFYTEYFTVPSQISTITNVSVSTSMQQLIISGTYSNSQSDKGISAVVYDIDSPPSMENYDISFYVRGTYNAI